MKNYIAMTKSRGGGGFEVRCFLHVTNPDSRLWLVALNQIETMIVTSFWGFYHLIEHEVSWNMR